MTALVWLLLVPQVGLLIIDEIHLLGADRGPILEVIVSRMR
jgi:replicative superfamily II helicase